MDDDDTCEDVDECDISAEVGVPPPCGENGDCYNTPGSYECVCADNYRVVDNYCEGECYGRITTYFVNAFYFLYYTLNIRLNGTKLWCMVSSCQTCYTSKFYYYNDNQI